MTNKTIYIPYTYCITFLLTGQRYYGCRYANNKTYVANPKDLWITYFTSSKVIKDLIALHGKESFTFQIRQTFKTTEETVAWEHKFLTRIDTAANPDWFNKSNGAGKFHVTKESEAKRLATKSARTPEENLASIEKMKATLKNTISAKTPEQKQATKEKMLVTKNTKTPEEKLASIEKYRATRNARTPEEKQATKEKRLASLNARTPEETQASKEKELTTKAKNKINNI